MRIFLFLYYIKTYQRIDEVHIVLETISKSNKFCFDSLEIIISFGNVINLLSNSFYLVNILSSVSV